jgi:hypothetical protein
MNILLTEQQLNKLLLEEAIGIDSFIDLMVEKYPQSKDYVDVIKKFIEDSDCKRIDVGPMMHGYGVSLSDRVLINVASFHVEFPMFLFIVFHEIAHQFQYKKYGEKKMYEVYLGDVDIQEGAKWMKEYEIVADEFALRKVRQLQKLGAIQPNETLFKPFYKIVPIQHFINLIMQIKSEIKQQGITDPSEISELIYNWVKPKV